MKTHLMTIGNLTNFVNREQVAGFVISPHNRNQDGLVGNSGFQLSEVEHAIFVDWQVSYFKTVFFKIFTGFQYGRVLHRGGDNMIPLMAQRFSSPLNSEVVPFTATGNKNNFCRRAIE